MLLYKQFRRRQAHAPVVGTYMGTPAAAGIYHKRVILLHNIYIYACLCMYAKEIWSEYERFRNRICSGGHLQR